MSKVCSEIEYSRQEDNMSIHSDCCPPDCSSENFSDKKWRKYIHKVLDEWLNNSNGTGGFYIKNREYDFEFEMFPMSNGINISWSRAREIYEVYCKLFGKDQSLEKIAERGGFGWDEVETFYKKAKEKGLLK